MGERTKFLRQYFKFIRMGAVRIGAGTDGSDFDPLAFINTDGSYVVVIKAAKGGEIDINGLPQGSYDIAYTTDQKFDVHLPEMIIETGQSLMAAIPARGVLTIVSQSPKSPERLYLTNPDFGRDSTLNPGVGKFCHNTSFYGCQKR